MQTHEYLLNLGKLVANLSSLEFAIRAFLLKYNEGHEPQVNIDTLSDGDAIPCNSLTNYDTLGELIRKFNDIIRPSNPAYCLDTTVVEVRDMIAHGRVAGKQPDPPYQLFKFGKHRNGMVPVERVVTVDLHWLSSNVNLVSQQILNVHKASNELGQNIMS